jgi:hypothetical protein
MRDVILLIVGGILAMIGGVITEYLKFRLEDKRRTRALRTLILLNFAKLTGLKLENRLYLSHF